jgi:hypothetical protein
MNWTIVSEVAIVCAPIGSFMLFIVRAIVQAENAKLMVQLNGTFIRAAGSTLSGAEIERSLNQLREDLDEVEGAVARSGRVSVYS